MNRLANQLEMKPNKYNFHRILSVGTYLTGIFTCRPAINLDLKPNKYLSSLTDQWVIILLRFSHTDWQKTSK